jgi:hypothetical protein
MSIEKTVNVSGGAFVDPPQVHADPVSEPGEAFVLATENPGVHVIGRGIDGRVDEERAAPEAAHKILALRTIFLPEHRIAIGVVLMPLGEWSVGIVQDGGAQVVVVPVVSASTKTVPSPASARSRLAADVSRRRGPLEGDQPRQISPGVDMKIWTMYSVSIDM